MKEWRLGGLLEARHMVQTFTLHTIQHRATRPGPLGTAHEGTIGRFCSVCFFGAGNLNLQNSAFMSIMCCFLSFHMFYKLSQLKWSRHIWNAWNIRTRWQRLFPLLQALCKPSETSETFRRLPKPRPSQDFRSLLEARHDTWWRSIISIMFNVFSWLLQIKWYRLQSAFCKMVDSRPNTCKK